MRNNIIEYFDTQKKDEINIKKIANAAKIKLNQLIKQNSNKNQKDTELGIFTFNFLKSLQNIKIMGEYILDPMQFKNKQKKGTTYFDYKKYQKYQLVPFFITNSSEELLAGNNDDFSFYIVLLVPAIGVKIKNENIQYHKNLFKSTPNLDENETWINLDISELPILKLSDNELPDIDQFFISNNFSKLSILSRKSKSQNRKSKSQNEKQNQNNKQNESTNIINIYKQKSENKMHIHKNKLSELLFNENTIKIFESGDGNTDADDADQKFKKEIDNSLGDIILDINTTDFSKLLNDKFLYRFIIIQKVFKNIKFELTLNNNVLQLLFNRINDQNLNATINYSTINAYNPIELKLSNHSIDINQNLTTEQKESKKQLLKRLKKSLKQQGFDNVINDEVDRSDANKYLEFIKVLKSVKPNEFIPFTDKEKKIIGITFNFNYEKDDRIITHITFKDNLFKYMQNKSIIINDILLDSNEIMLIKEKVKVEKDAILNLHDNNKQLKDVLNQLITGKKAEIKDIGDKIKAKIKDVLYKVNKEYIF